VTPHVFDTSIFVRYEASLGRADLLLSIVVFEMVAGAVDEEERKLWRGLYLVAEAQGRLLTPSPADWYEAGKILNSILRARKPRARIRKEELALLFRDVLIARLIKRAQAVLVTENVKDFDLIRRFCQIRTVSGAEFFSSPGRRKG
jgi:hypothetical protein